MALLRRISRVKEYFTEHNYKRRKQYVLSLHFRKFCDDKTYSPEFSNSTIFVENGFNVEELPVVIRKLKDITNIIEVTSTEPVTTDAVDYSFIQIEFKQCEDLRDVFSLLSKCTKITPNIALGAMERIYDIENNPVKPIDGKSEHTHSVKDAIINKLLKIIVKTEDTQTILNILQSASTFIEPYKYKFCDELLFRSIDNKMSVEQICAFSKFLIQNKCNARYSDIIDKLWVGLVGKESDINETNIAMVFDMLPGLKLSKRIVSSLLEQKLSDLWYKIKLSVMQDILSSFVQEKYLVLQSFATVGRWLKTNIHTLDEDSLLDIISKITRLKYNDDQIEKAVEKYMKLKGDKIQSHVFVVGILNYCMQFQICNKIVLNACGEYFVQNFPNIPPSFLKSYIYPFGFLNFNPKNTNFWHSVDKVLNTTQHTHKINIEDICSIILSHIYLGNYPLKLVSKVFGLGNLTHVNNPEVLRNLNLIDTAMSLECPNYTGPLIPKNQWCPAFSQDIRIKNIVDKILKILKEVAGGSDKLSTEVMVPNLSDKMYMIDVMMHPVGAGGSTFNWKAKSLKNVNIAILIHLPDHYCSDSENLTGPQIMRKRHLKILGLKVVSVKYSILSKFYTSYNTKGMIKYLTDSIKNAEECV